MVWRDRVFDSGPVDSSSNHLKSSRQSRDGKANPRRLSGLTSIAPSHSLIEISSPGSMTLLPVGEYCMKDRDGGCRISGGGADAPTLQRERREQSLPKCATRIHDVSLAHHKVHYLADGSPVSPDCCCCIVKLSYLRLNSAFSIAVICEMPAAKALCGVDEVCQRVLSPHGYELAEALCPLLRQWLVLRSTSAKPYGPAWSHS